MVSVRIARVRANLIKGNAFADGEAQFLPSRPTRPVFVERRIDLVQIAHHGGNADPAARQNVFPPLRHRDVGRGAYRKCAIHLRRTDDPVLAIEGE